MFNKAILMGRLTKDPELKTTNSGVSVCTFSIAVDRSYTAKGEDKKADFFNIVAWRATADFVAKYFGKGKCILVEGEIQNRSYEGKDGNTRYITEIIANNVSFTGESKQAASKPSDSPQANGKSNYTPAESKASSAVTEAEDSDEEYPF